MAGAGTAAERAGLAAAGVSQASGAPGPPEPPQLAAEATGNWPGGRHTGRGGHRHGGERRQHGPSAGRQLGGRCSCLRRRRRTDRHGRRYRRQPGADMRARYRHSRRDGPGAAVGVLPQGRRLAAAAGRRGLGRLLAAGAGSGGAGSRRTGAGGGGAGALRFPRAADLAGRAWWAFGFADRDPSATPPTVLSGPHLLSAGSGWTPSPATSRGPGFSGGGLWSPDYQAVVGVVGQAHDNGDGRAVTLHQADLASPSHKLAALAGWSAEAAGEAALQQWGWTLARDPEGVRHWRPRARGVSIDSERGYRFRGRAAALDRIVAWLDRPQPDRRVLVVTGSPGVGKSAVLGPDRHHRRRRHPRLASARRPCRPRQRGLGRLRGPRQGEDGAGGRRGDRPRRIRPAARTEPTTWRLPSGRRWTSAAAAGST